MSRFLDDHSTFFMLAFAAPIFFSLIAAQVDPNANAQSENANAQSENANAQSENTVAAPANTAAVPADTAAVPTDKAAVPADSVISSNEKSITLQDPIFKNVMIACNISNGAITAVATLKKGIPMHTVSLVRFEKIRATDLYNVTYFIFLIPKKLMELDDSTSKNFVKSNMLHKPTPVDEAFRIYKPKSGKWIFDNVFTAPGISAEYRYTEVNYTPILHEIKITRGDESWKFENFKENPFVFTFQRRNGEEFLGKFGMDVADISVKRFKWIH